MATFDHPWGEGTVKSSLNKFIKDNLVTNLPTWMSWVSTPSVGQARTLNFDYPEQPFQPPSFGVAHLGSDELMKFGGDRADGTNKGTMRFGLMEVDCYVSSKNNFAWAQQLSDMRDMVFKLLQQNRAIALYDFTNPTTPVALNAIVRTENIREVAVQPDPGNPALKKKRILVRYFWVERF